LSDVQTNYDLITKPLLVHLGFPDDLPVLTILFFDKRFQLLTGHGIFDIEVTALQERSEIRGIDCLAKRPSTFFSTGAGVPLGPK